MNNVQKTSPALPRPSNPTKQNLSNSSISPNQNDKKTKVYVSPNRFARFATNDNDKATTMSLTNLKKDPVNQSHTKRDIGPLAPLIHVKNSSAFNKVLTNITDENGFTCKLLTASYIIIQLAGRQNFSKITDHLHEIYASFHSYTPRHFHIEI